MHSLGKRKISFSSLLRDPQQLRTPMSYENSFIKLDEERKLNTRKYKEQMKKNRLKVKIRET